MCEASFFTARYAKNIPWIGLGLNGEAAIYAIAKEIVTDGYNSMRGNTRRAQSLLEATLNYPESSASG